MIVSTDLAGAHDTAIVNTWPRWRRSATALIGLALAGLALAQSAGGDFEITQSSLDAGGGVSAAAEFELTGTIAQVDANTSPLVGGDFILAGGLWGRARDGIFTDDFESN